jgi:ribokinase
MVPPDGKKGIVMAANANNAWSDTDADAVVQAVHAAAPDSVLVTNCEIPLPVVEKAMRAARQKGFKTILDPSPAGRVNDALLGLADAITPNASEAKTLTGIECKDLSSAVHAANNLRERGASMVCIKMHDGGCVLVEENQTIHVAAAPVQVIDTTGAGDAFAGALAVGLLEQRAYADALRFAVAASHVAVTGYGSQPAYPARSDVEKMEKHLKLNADAGTSS